MLNANVTGASLRCATTASTGITTGGMPSTLALGSSTSSGSTPFFVGVS
jgi:hypothetical protein